MESEKSGCLGMLASLFGAARGEATRRDDLEPLNLNEPSPYRLRADFLSDTELSFYRVLESVVADRASILSAKYLNICRREFWDSSRRERSGNVRMDLVRASNVEECQKYPVPDGCAENDPAPALLVGYSPMVGCALLAP